MQITFNSLDEVRAFTKSLKGTRGPKGDGDEGDTPAAPAPAMPPVQGAPPMQQIGQQVLGAMQGFAAHGQGNPFPAADPTANGLIQRIVGKIDASLASGQPSEPALNWFRSQCGSEAALATMDQIKTVFLPRMTAAALENVAKLIGA